MPNIPLDVILFWAFMAAMLLAMAYQAYRMQAWRHWGSNHVAGAFFLLASAVFWISIFPQGPLGDQREISPVGLAIAAALFAPAVGTMLYRMRHHLPVDKRNVWVGLLLFAAMGVAFGVRHGDLALPPLLAEATLWAVALPWVVMLLILLIAVLRVYFHPGNRMARMIQAERYDQAIKLGEAIPTRKREPLIVTNLMSAYRAAGRHADAIALAETIPAHQRDAVMLITLASAYHAAGRSAEARAAFEQIKPDDHWPEAVKEHVANVGRDIGGTHSEQINHAAMAPVARTRLSTGLWMD